MKNILLLLVVPALAFANVGKITVLKGDVQIKRDGQSLQAKSGTILEKSDFISTDKNGKVQIVFTDNTIFTIGKSSTLDIADYLYDESQPKKNTAKFNVLKGAFSSITGRIGKLNKSKFKLKTKSASIGIRGTIVQANQDVVMCTEGAITVTTLSGETVRVEAGYRTSVASGTPTTPTVIQAGEVEELGVEVTQEDTQTVNQDEVAQDNTNDQEQQTQEQVTDQVNTQEISADLSSTTQNNEVEEYASRNVVLTGRTIDADGNQQSVNINAQNIQGDLNLEDQGMITESDTADIGNDETISWGHWADDPNKKWVAGQATEVQVLDSLRNSDSTVNASYNGQVSGTVNGSDDIKTDSTNQVNINFELGGGKNEMDGSIEFQTESGQEWNSEFSGSTSGNTFTNDTISGSTTSGETTSQITSGGVDGQFYGDDAQAVGGTFNLNTQEDSATGVFKATK